MAYARHKLRQCKQRKPNWKTKASQQHLSAQRFPPLLTTPLHPPPPLAATLVICFITRVRNLLTLLRATHTLRGLQHQLAKGCVRKPLLPLPPLPWFTPTLSFACWSLLWSVFFVIIIMFVCPFVALDWRTNCQLGIAWQFINPPASTIRCATPRLVRCAAPCTCSCVIDKRFPMLTYISAAARFLSHFNGILTAENVDSDL